jgi:hypothetical protein
MQLDEAILKLIWAAMWLASCTENTTYLVMLEPLTSLKALAEL